MATGAILPLQRELGPQPQIVLSPAEGAQIWLVATKQESAVCSSAPAAQNKPLLIRGRCLALSKHQIYAGKETHGQTAERQRL